MHEDANGNAMSRKKMKKMQRIMRRPNWSDKQEHTGRSGELCVNYTCRNPLVR